MNKTEVSNLLFLLRCINACMKIRPFITNLTKEEFPHTVSKNFKTERDDKKENYLRGILFDF